MTVRRWIIVVLAVVALALGLGYVWMVRHPLEAIAAVRRHELKSAGFEAREIEAAAGAVRLFEAGEGPPLILLHGVGDHAGTWAGVAPAFTDRYRVLAVDLPGHGDSAPREGPLRMAEVVAGAEAVLVEAASGGEPAIVVGNSLGGWLASILALRHPEDVERLVLVSAGGLSGEISSLQPTNREEARELVERLRHPDSEEIPDFVLDALVRRAADPETPISRLTRDGEGLVAHLLDEEISGLEVPADLVWGEADGLLDLDYGVRMRQAIPAARLTVLERCGHVPSVECPERLVETLEEVLAGEPPDRKEPGVDGGEPREAER